MATGLTTLKILKDDKIADKVAARGEWLKGKLADLQKRYPVIGGAWPRSDDRSGNREAGRSAGSHGLLPGRWRTGRAAAEKCFENGLILERGGRNGCVLRLLPSLLITNAELEIFLDKFENALLGAGVKPV